MRGAIRVGQDIALLIARVALGIILGAHGWHRWVTGVNAQVAVLEEAGVPQPMLIAWGATVAELVGGILLVFGLATRLVGLVVVVQNILIIVWMRWEHGLFAADGGFELNLALAALGLLFVALGSGRGGVDALFKAPRRPADPAAAPRVVNEADPA